MIRLVTIGGSGDAYLVCALLAAFRERHKRSDVIVIGKSKYEAIANMFGAPYACDDDLVQKAERDPAMQRSYENVLIAPDTTFYVHPCFLRSGVRVDKLTMGPDASQADMYRAMLDTGMNAPLAVPTRLPVAEMEPDRVLIIPNAVSWPNTQPKFWTMLADNLSRIGRDVIWTDESWTFGELLRQCMQAEWVIGPQCGVMSILCTGEFPCRKTLASAILNEANKKLAFLSARTFPYAYVTKFSNLDYEVEEYEITDDNHAELVAGIINGINAGRIVPHDPRPIIAIQAPLSPGDFLDRLAVLTVKRRNFEGRNRALVEREYRRFLHLRSITEMPPEINAHFAQLVALHQTTFDLLQRLVPMALSEGADVRLHDQAIRLNRDRIELKSRIDRACRAPYTDVKSYY